MKTDELFASIGVAVVALVAIEVIAKTVRGLDRLRYKRALRKFREKEAA